MSEMMENMRLHLVILQMIKESIIAHMLIHTQDMSLKCAGSAAELG